MPTPAKGYRLADGTRVPGVTTVLNNLGWKTEGLKHWAWQMGMDGLSLRDTTQKAADIGTIAHDMVDCAIHDRPFDPSQFDPALLDEARVAFEAYTSWASSYDLAVVETEVHLVSETWRFGGTPDCVAMVKGKLYLFDWKTSNAVYPDYICQLAAYWQLWNECRVNQHLEPGAHLVRFGKDGSFAHHWIAPAKLDLGWEAFLAARKLHDLRKPLENAA